MLFAIVELMAKSVAVVGAGINGLLAAFLITEKYPSLQISIYEVEERPGPTTKHKGITHGARDARHITGSESIGFESSIHKDALRNTPLHEMAGWLLKDEKGLTPSERLWRDTFESSYSGTDTLSTIDFAHAELNYKGLKAWHKMTKAYPFIRKHVITDGGIEVYFRDQVAFEGDLEMETEFCRRYFATGRVKVIPNKTFNDLYAKGLLVPGLSIRIKSLALELLNRLEQNQNVSFHWNEPIRSGAQISNDVIAWTSGVTHAQPLEYRKYSIQGIVGCWVTIPNPGYEMPFKIAAPAPSAYINFTPDKNDLYVSGGFGWTGEYTDDLIVRKIARPIAEHFVKQINTYLGTNLPPEDADYCVRPSTPTGQPLLLTKKSGNKTSIYITGSAKSGTTHAPILSEYVLRQLLK